MYQVTELGTNPKLRVSDVRSCNTLNVHPVNPNLTPGYRTYVDYDIGDISVVRHDLNGREIKND